MTTSIVLARLVDAPDLVQRLRALPPPAFSALVRRVGVEDAGQLVALATTEQLVAAFDEDLFANPAPGEREVFDAGRFAIWLEVLLEAGDAVAAARVAELSIDFVIHALGQLVMVLDHEALMMRMEEGGRAGRRVDKAIASALSEELEGYLIISRRHDGWDAVIALLLALDRDHRAFLEGVLHRSSVIAGEYLDDLETLAEVLSEQDSVAEDVEAEREARRSARGYVEPRAARAFLELAKKPLTPRDPLTRDPLTRAYFRDLDPIVAVEIGVPDELIAALAELDETRTLPAPLSPVLEALRTLDSATYAARLAELAYLANVLVAAGTHEARPALAELASVATLAPRRYSPHEATTEIVAIVERALAARGATDLETIAKILSEVECDRLFREAMAGRSAVS